MRILFKTMLAGLSALALAGGPANAAEIRVMISGGFTPAYTSLIPQFEAMTGDKLVTIRGSSMGPPPNSIPARLAAGEAADTPGLAGAGTMVGFMRYSFGDSTVGAGSLRPMTPGGGGGSTMERDGADTVVS